MLLCYRAVTTHNPRATLAAKSALPASKIKKPRSSLFCFSTINLLAVASKKEFNIHWPSKAKQGIALTTASAPESEIRYLFKLVKVHDHSHFLKTHINVIVSALWEHSNLTELLLFLFILYNSLLIAKTKISKILVVKCIFIQDSLHKEKTY